METRSRLTGARREGGGGEKVKKGKSLVKEQVDMNDPRTWIAGWGLTVGTSGGRGREEEVGKIGTTIIE